VDVQALASGHSLLFPRQSIVCGRISIAQSCYRLLIAKDDQILFERYQYRRSDRDRTVQFATSVKGHTESLAVPLEPSVAPIVFWPLPRCGCHLTEVDPHPYLF
jgi:hypothetical protein